MAMPPARARTHVAGVERALVFSALFKFVRLFETGRRVKLLESQDSAPGSIWNSPWHTVGSPPIPGRPSSLNGPGGSPGFKIFRVQGPRVPCEKITRKASWRRG